MGSLILLLLVLDRRAKVVARAKTRAQQEAVLAQQSKAERDRLRDFEQKRDLLRQQLKEQEASLHASLDSLQTQIQKKKQESLQERGRTLELQTRLAALRQVLAREQEGYEQAQRQTATVAAKKTRLLTEHEGLTREVVNLERALADVIAFRKRQAQTYSLVPYRGKSGDNRRPVYIECQSDQLIVHPERTIAKTGSWDGSNQLQSLAEKLKARLDANAAESKQKPYVLFLVPSRRHPPPTIKRSQPLACATSIPDTN
jgi:Predicted membrane protein